MTESMYGDEELEDVKGEVIADLGCDDGVTSSDYRRDVGAPTEPMVKEDTEHLDGWRWGNG